MPLLRPKAGVHETSDAKIQKEVMTQMIERIGRILMVARGCNQKGGAAEGDRFPCPFCSWDLDAKEESGCFSWAAKILTEIREPTEAMLTGALIPIIRDPSLLDGDARELVRALYSSAIDAALK